MAESQITMPQVSTAWPCPQAGRLTYEGLFVGASLLHVRAWPDSTATVVHLVHDTTTWKEGKGEGTLVPLTGMRKHPWVTAKGIKKVANSAMHITKKEGHSIMCQNLRRSVLNHFFSSSSSKYSNISILVRCCFYSKTKEL